MGAGARVTPGRAGEVPTNGQEARLPAWPRYGKLRGGRARGCRGRLRQARCKRQERHLHGVMSLVLKPSTVIFLPCTGVRASVRETARGSMWVHRRPGCLSGAQDRSHPQVLRRLHGVGFLPKEYILVSFVHMTIILSILKRGLFSRKEGTKMMTGTGSGQGGGTFGFCCLAPS